MTGDAITVAVATCGRPSGLVRCLEALATGTVRPGQLIIVDQAPCADSRLAVERCRIAGTLYLEQPRLGLSASRNLGLAQASGAVLAVTDDDCVPDPHWIDAIVAAFGRSPAAAAVTGPIVPWGPRPTGGYAVSSRAVAPAADHRDRVLPWLAGSGGNFAARSDLLRRKDGWDERLGIGSPGKAAEDIDLLYRILRDGGIVRYEPAAVVRHEWQTRDRRLATRSSYGHGIGALCGLWLRRRDAFAVRMLTTYGIGHLRQLAGAARRRDRRGFGEHARTLASLPAGLLYGMRASNSRAPGSN